MKVASPSGDKMSGCLLNHPMTDHHDNHTDGENMTKQYVIPLCAPQADLERVGGKGMSLAKLANAGLPVPDGFHITTEAYRQFVQANDLQPGIDAALGRVDASQPSTLDATSEAIGLLFAGASIPDEIADAIREAYASLRPKTGKLGQNTAVNGQSSPVSVAVRSSATAEDLPEASFAGQQETYLNISGAGEVLEATRKCWASLWTARAIGYRARQGAASEGAALAVVVQILVNAEAAGIMFTANPLNGKRDEVIINAAWGLGEAVVGGAVNPDTLTVSKLTGDLIARNTAEKLVMTVRTESGTEEQPVPGSLRNVPVLSDEQAAVLARYGVEIEELYGMPMDIVQARPVTAMPEAPLEWPLPDPKGIYMRTSIADLMPRALSPLFVTMGIPTLREQMWPLAKRVIGGNPVLGEYYFTSINTYAYMNSSFPARGWFWILFHMIPAYPRLLRILVPFWRDELHPEYQAAVTSKQDLVPSQMSVSELWTEAQELFEAAAYYMDGLMFATMGASAGSEMLFTRVYDRMAKQEGDPEASALLMGWDNIPVRSEKSLYDIAMWVREDEKLTDYILDTSSHDLTLMLDTPASAPTPLFAEFATRLQTHLHTFGHVVFQLDFAEPLPLDHPEMMLESIKMYLRGKGANPHERQKASEKKRIRTTEVMLERLKGLKLWIFRKVLGWAQSLAEVREDALAEIGLAYPRLRELFRELGYRFVKAGVIQQVDDIFWLEKDEIDVCDKKPDGNQALESLAGHVEKRRAFNQRVGQVTPPPMIPLKERVMGFKADTFIALTEEAQAGNVLKGVPASAGVVTAPARILHGPADFDQMRPGDVLVAGTTTPAWTPLFAMASAVVTDIGGPLSHGSIVAREYGIPAVMGTGVATRRIQSGQIITVDGTKGEVILETAEEEPEKTAPPTEWIRPDPKATYARGSLAEHTPSPVSPLFATFGLGIANRETDRLWSEVIGKEDFTLFDNGFYHTINGYVYGGFRMTGKDLWYLMKVMVLQSRYMYIASAERWQAAQRKFADIIAAWEEKPLESLSPTDLLQGVNKVFGGAAEYYTVTQASTLPSATTSEMLFVLFYNKLIKRKQDPEATVFLLGFYTLPVEAEKSLFDIATWLKGKPSIADYLQHTPTKSVLSDFKHGTPPATIPTDLWGDWCDRFQRHLEEYGKTAYEFDFANPTPAEAPDPLLDAIKMYLEGKGSNPHERQREAAEKREQATRSVLDRIGWPRKRWFQKLLKWAQDAGPTREDSIFNMGMGHPLIRRMFHELGCRSANSKAIPKADDIYWLEQREVEELVKCLEYRQPLPDLSSRIPTRKAEWQAALQASPPVMLPERSRWGKLLGGGEVKEKDGKVVLKGVGTSSGQVTAPACVLYGPEDFPKMKPGDVLVAATTTPAWTPLFAMASAVVTDIGGPLSHSSIVAREYGIPAVMAARNATRYICSRQIVTVDGQAGSVTY
jgi:phosphoenolpyruvate synthase/pyruvate phosphate dikinase